MGATKTKCELESLVGVYRSQPFEVSSSTPLEPQPQNNINEDNSSYTSLVSPSSTQLSPPLSVHKSKNNSQKKPLASSLENSNVNGNKTETKPTSGEKPLFKPKEPDNSVHVNSLKNTSVGQSQPSNHKVKKVGGNKTNSLFSFSKNPLSKSEKRNKPPHNSVQVNSSKNPLKFATMGQSQSLNNNGKNVDGNKSKTQSASSRNPLARTEKHNEPVETNKSLDNMVQSMNPKSKAPAPKGILQNVKPPALPTTHDENSTSLQLIHNSSTSLKLTDDNSVMLKLSDKSTSLKLTEGSSTSLKLETQIPLHVSEQEESES